MRSLALVLALAPAVAVAEEAASAEKPLVTYDKGFVLRSPDDVFELKIGTQLQFRYTWEDIEEDDEVDTNFSIPRARLKFSGHVFNEDLLYKIQIDFGKGQVLLKDWYAEYGIDPDWLWIRGGQFKRPFSRQQITSSSELVLIDRAITDKAFGAGRDLGMFLGDRYEKSPPFEWVIGVFNGTGESPAAATVNADGEVVPGTNIPDRFLPAVVARAAYNFGDIDGYTEGDLKGGPLRFSVGASAIADFDVDDDGVSGLRAEVDTIVKVAHFSFDGEFFTRSTAGDNPFDDIERDAIGALAEVSWFIGGHWMPAARFALVAPTGDDDDTREMIGGIGYFFYGHPVKLQADGGIIQQETADGTLNNVRVRAQLQFAF
jgi:hypothetical protein